MNNVLKFIIHCFKVDLALKNMFKYIPLSPNKILVKICRVMRNIEVSWLIICLNNFQNYEDVK